MTNKGRPPTFKKVVTVWMPTNPTPENWVDFIPETKECFFPLGTGEWLFFLLNIIELIAISKVLQYDYDGN